MAKFRDYLIRKFGRARKVEGYELPFVYSEGYDSPNFIVTKEGIERTKKKREERLKKNARFKKKMDKRADAILNPKKWYELFDKKMVTDALESVFEKKADHTELGGAVNFVELELMLVGERYLPLVHLLPHQSFRYTPREVDKIPDVRFLRWIRKSCLEN